MKGTQAPPGPIDRREDDTSLLIRFLLAAVGLYLLVYVAPIGFRPMFRPDDMRYAEIAREMLLGGDWLVPRINGLLYFEKPPLGYWLNTVSLAIFGENPFAIRLPSTLAAGATGVLVYVVSRRMALPRRTAAAATMIYLSFLLVLIVGEIAVLDGMFTLFLNGGIATWFLATRSPDTSHRHGLLWLAGLLLGLAFLVKGFLAWAMPVLVALPWLLSVRAPLRVYLRGAVVVLAALITVAPWAVAIHLAQPDFWRYFFWIEHIQRFMGENAQHSEPAYYFLVLLPLVAFPWLALLPAAIAGHRRRAASEQQRLDTRFLVLWTVLPFLFFSASRGKLLTYILPCYAPLAILLAQGLEAYLREGGRRLLTLGLSANAALLVIVAVVVSADWLRGDAAQIYTAEDSAALVRVVCAIGLALVTLFVGHRQRGYPTLVATSLASAVGFLVIQLSLPADYLRDEAPGPLFRDSLGAVDPDTVVISDGSLVRTACWFLKRTDVFTFGAPGEIAYGLSAENQAGRHLDTEAIRRMIDAESADRDVLFLCKSDCPADVLALMPDGTDRYVHGRFHAYRLNAR